MSGRVEVIRDHCLQVRYYQEFCTDPQRRCYNGAFAKSEYRWTEWRTLLKYSKEAAESTMETFKRANGRDREYRVIPVSQETESERGL